MKSNISLFFDEIVIAGMLFLVLALKSTVFYYVDIPMVTWPSVIQVSQNCFDLNLALVIAFIVVLITEDAFRHKGRKLPVIAKHTMRLVTINSIALLVSPMLDIYALTIAVPALYGNARRVWDLSKNMLDAI